MKRRILFFTGTRAEYGLLKSVIRRVAERHDACPELLVSGSHLSASFGSTIQEIEKDAPAPLHNVDICLNDDSPKGVCNSMGLALSRYGAALEDLHPDLLVVLGDRYEAFCAVAAAAVQRIPVAHLHGGETTQGAVDEYFRHAMTKMSHLHFASCEFYRQRIIRMGEAPERVWNVGALGVENIRTIPVLPEQDVRAFLGLPAGVPYIVGTYHPVTLHAHAPEDQLSRIFKSLESFPDLHVVFTGANADAGGSHINTLLSQWADSSARAHFFLSLGVERYLNAVRYAAGVIGNSSSGILEIPSLGIPVLDIGSRQQGRERSRAVIHCEPEEAELLQALRLLLSSETRERARQEPNPYDQPNTADIIAEKIASYDLQGILIKRFYDGTE
ncbi:UDP-N-acetylglucosamine 2-epimerase [Desulfovibrio piger]|nr:UDP-N-acetylglucosamine 2-epimerase [Desulfovibrio piger]